MGKQYVINVDDKNVSVYLDGDNEDYISLTDMVRGMAEILTTG